MTDTNVRVDLDEYAQTLKDLNEEISAYGNERRSLNGIAAALGKLNESNRKVFDGVEETIGYGTAVLRDLGDLGLPEALTRIGSRYEEHQQSLKSLQDTMQQIVQEQQRSALEMLQNAQQNKQALEIYAESVKVANAGQEKITRQLEALASAMEASRATQAKNEKQVQLLRTLLIITVILVVAVGGLLIAL